jgi:hypothetical protein
MDDDFNYISLAALTANVLRWLELGHHHQSDGQRDAGGNGEPRKDGGNVEQPLGDEKPAT